MQSYANNLSGLVLKSLTDIASRQHLLLCNELKFQNTLGSSKWERYVYHSLIPLAMEDPSIQGPYTYVIFCRRDHNQMILSSTVRSVVDVLVDRLFELGSPLRRVLIQVDRLVRELTEHPMNYVLSSVHARVPAFGTSLRAISFYGDDVGEASLFRDNMSLASFYVCGIRLAAGGSELARFGSDGMISFLLTSPDRLQEVNSVFSFLRKNNYIL